MCIRDSLYKGYKPVLWSTVEKTALADAEVEYMDHISDTIYTSFPIKKTSNKSLEGCEIIIWTTTPWTIPANKALAFNKDINYQTIKILDDGDFKNKKIVIASDLLEQVLKECEIKKFERIGELQGKEFKNIICSHPLEKEGYTYDIPMLEASFVTTEQGSGIVPVSYTHLTLPTKRIV